MSCREISVSCVSGLYYRYRRPDAVQSHVPHLQYRQETQTKTIMRIFLTTAVAAVATALVAGSTAARAGPAMSWASNDVDYAQDVCMQRAEGAFAREGWSNIHHSGSPALSIAAEKGTSGRCHPLS
jgi:hypothetical protein